VGREYVRERDLRQRRSIRTYTESKPSVEMIRAILESGRWAPSGLNNQPWRFVVMTDHVMEDQEGKNGLAPFTTYGDIMRGAPVLIVVCMDRNASYNRDKDLVAIGACIQNMLLTAHELGLGACWLGEILNRKKEVAAILGFAENMELMAVVTLGYPMKMLETENVWHSKNWR
jgi:nitroreductase